MTKNPVTPVCAPVHPIRKGPHPGRTDQDLSFPGSEQRVTSYSGYNEHLIIINFFMKPCNLRGESRLNRENPILKSHETNMDHSAGAGVY